MGSPFEYREANPFEFDRNLLKSNVQGRAININNFQNFEREINKAEIYPESKKESEIKKSTFASYPDAVFNYEIEHSVKKLEERLKDAENENLRRNIEALGGIEDTISS